MAEPLGTAELILTVNDKALRQGLADARKLIDGLQADVTRTTTNATTRARRTQTTTSGGARVPRTGGAREGTRALEIAQERRFRLSQRIESLEERGANVARLRNRLGQLTEAQSNRQFGTFRQISQELSRQVTLTERRVRLAEQAQRLEQQAARVGAKQGGSRESIDALTNAQKRRYNLDQQIRSLEAGGVRTDRLRTQLGEATTAQANRQFGSFNRIADSLEFALRKERDRLRVLRDQNRELERQARRGGPSEPLRGRVGLTDSPADLAFRARQGGARSPIGGTRNIPDSPAGIREEQRLAAARERSARAAERARIAEDRAAIAEGRRIGRLNTSPIGGRTSIANSPAAIQAEARRVAETEIRRQAKIQGIRDYLSTGGRDRSVLTGTTAFARPNPEAVRAEQALQKERLKTADITLRSARADRTAGERAGAGRLGRAAGIASNALIGGAFPLLFGQGLGASAGGALGGGLGGALGGQFGFGLSLVGTALGAQIDLAIQKSQTLAKALDDPIGSFGELQQAALLSSKGVEKTVASLIAQGREAEAAAQIQLDLATRFGDTSELDGLRNSYDELGRAFNQLSVLTAKFVAGPLSGFLSKLASTFTAASSNALFKERLAEAPADVQKEARARVRSAAADLSGSGLSTAEVATQAFAEGLRFLNERLGTTKEIAAAEAALAKATQRQAQLNSLTTREIQAQVKGYELQSLILKRQGVDVQRLQDIAATPAKADEINLAAYREQVAIYEQFNKLLRDRQAQSNLESVQNALKAQSIAEQVRNTQALAAAEKGVERQTLATVQAIQTGINEAKRREQELGAQIDAARLRGGDAGEQEAARLVEQQKLAANETRLELEKGALALKEAGEQLRDNIRSAVVEVTRVRSDPNGLNRFLNPQQIDQRNRTDFQLLLPSFRQAQSRFTRLTGAAAPEFRGPIDGVNEAIRDFINAVDKEFDSTKNLNDSINAANQVNSELLGVNVQLARATAVLAQKNWQVNVAVQGGQASAYGDVLNGALSQ